MQPFLSAIRLAQPIRLGGLQVPGHPGRFDYCEIVQTRQIVEAIPQDDTNLSAAPGAVAAPAEPRMSVPRIDPRIVVGKVLRRLWSTHRAIAVVRELTPERDPAAARLRVEFVQPDLFDPLPRLVEEAKGIEYLYVRPIERTRLARAGTLSVARDADGELMAFHFVHDDGDYEALDQVAPGMYPPMPPDEVLTEAVYCLPAFRGQAIAPKLLAATGARLAAQGKRRAWAYLDTTNIAALRMFNRAGYAPSGAERVDRYRFGRFRTEFRELTPKTVEEWDAEVAGSRERRGMSNTVSLRGRDQASVLPREDFALEAELASVGPRLNATSGEPVESKLVLYSDRTTEIGIWEVTPGTFPARKDEVCELMQFIAGRGTITDATGTTEIRPGVTMFTPDGWSGTWDVQETVRKTYALHRTTSLSHHAIQAASRRIRAKLARG
jgi:uncharacterized protein